MKAKGINEALVLSLLQKVIPQTTTDPSLVSAICDGVAREIRLMKNIEAFEKLCEEGGIPNLEKETVTDLQNELGAKFGEDNVVITPDEDGTAVAVEIELPDQTTMSSRVKVDPSVLVEEVKVPFVPFPVCLPEDPELVWALGRREDLGPDEADRALAQIQEEFWETKKGQQLQRDKLEKSFAEFIIHVPASALNDSGLKRHYKAPEALKTLRLLKPQKSAAVAEAAAAPW